MLHQFIQPLIIYLYGSFLDLLLFDFPFFSDLIKVFIGKLRINGKKNAPEEFPSGNLFSSISSSGRYWRSSRLCLTYLHTFLTASSYWLSSMFLCTTYDAVSHFFFFFVKIFWRKLNQQLS